VAVRPRLRAVGALLGEIAQRGLDGRPVLLLLGGELQPRLQRGDARVGEGCDVLGALPHAHAFARRCGLRKRSTCAGKHKSDRSGSNCFLHHGHLLDGAFIRCADDEACHRIRKLSFGHEITAMCVRS
jgi:hypothetical protein